MNKTEVVSVFLNGFPLVNYGLPVHLYGVNEQGHVQLAHPRILKAAGYPWYKRRKNRITINYMVKANG